MVQSVELREAVSESRLAFGVVNFRIRLCVDLLAKSAMDTKSFNTTYLKGLRLFCHDRLHSMRIFTQRNIISSPPLKSIPSCTTSPSLTGHGLLSTPGGLRRRWFKKVPELDLTSLMYHCEFSHQNSQCFRETTLDLNPTGAADVDAPLGTSVPNWSLSEYLPTRMTASDVGKVLDMAWNVSDGRDARES
jgi:hypothetical protein